MNARRSALPGLALLAATGLQLGPLAGSALAHVTIQPGEAEQGGYTAFAFRVPNERDDAGTTKLEVTFPADHPFSSARTKPLPGWTANVVQEGESVKSVTWTADPGVRINPTEYQEFWLSLGPLPEDGDELLFPAVQTYDSGEVVAWDTPTPEEGSEPERPAPVLALTASDGDGHHSGGSDHASASHPDDSDTTARWLGGAGLAVGALGLGAGAGAVLRTRRQAS